MHKPHSSADLGAGLARAATTAAHSTERSLYANAVRWIASNDEPDMTSIREVSEQVSVLLIADLFGFTPEKVATSIVRKRYALRAAARGRAIVRDYAGLDDDHDVARNSVI